jgi:hypothetical protein
MILCIESQVEGQCAMVTCMKHLQMFKLLVREKYDFRGGKMNFSAVRQSMEMPLSNNTAININ